VLLDALGTLLSFEPPAPHLRAALARRGHDVTADAAEAAIRAEIAYYRAHLHEGADAASLAGLRARCAEAMQPALPGVPLAHVLAALMEALRFFAYPDAIPALTGLREARIRTVVVSNWDASLHERLTETGLAVLVDGALASAEVGAAKPDRAIFAAALELAGAAPEEAWHVGDTLVADVEGARAAGLTAVLIDREGAARRGAAQRAAGAAGRGAGAAGRGAGAAGRGAGAAEAPPGVRVIGSLTELLPLVAYR
jgi:putative hydrolase of the HAD superfamily